jgi:GNAT superfamily N-acetyltransferase
MPNTKSEIESEAAGLARQVDAAQSILTTPAAAQARRLEQAQARLCVNVAVAMAEREPTSGAGALVRDSGCAIFAGAGSPLTQGMAMGLAGIVSAADLDAFEAHLAPHGGPRQLELCPFADPSLPALLAERRYRVHEWQLVWTRALDDAPPAPTAEGDVHVRPVAPGEEDLFLRVLLAGFLESEAVPPEAMDLLRPTTFAAGYELYLAFIGDEPVGGGTLACTDGVALVAGSGVRPAHRRRGAQAALLRARLARARALGCDLAASSTLPGTASRRNMERHGFTVAYPKLVMLRD